MLTVSASGLTTAQQRIVEWGDGPLVVIAGAGTGKTRVIVERVRWLVEAKGLAARADDPLLPEHQAQGRRPCLVREAPDSSSGNLSSACRTRFTGSRKLLRIRTSEWMLEKHLKASIAWNWRRSVRACERHWPDWWSSWTEAASYSPRRRFECRSSLSCTTN